MAKCKEVTDKAPIRRHPYPDIFGVGDLDRHFLRRPYSNYIDGADEDGEIRSGLNFIACMRNILEQFEYVATMWQMNPDFPVKGMGIDALYAHKILSTIYGGYYFRPPAPRDERDSSGRRFFQLVGGGGPPLLIRRMLPRVFVLR